MAIKIESINGKTDIIVSWAEKVKALGIQGLKFEGNIVGIRDEKDETLTLKVANQGDGNLTILNGLSSTWEDIIRHQAEGDAVILRFDIPEVASINTSILQRGIATSIPDLSIPMLTSMYMHERQLHPNPIGARDLQSITIEFKLDEEMKNFYYFYCWIDAMRHGETCGKKSLKGEELLRMDCIDAIEIVSLNNDPYFSYSNKW